MKKLLFILLPGFLFVSCEDTSEQATTDINQNVRGILTESIEGIVIPTEGGGTLYTCSTAEPVVFSDPKGLFRKALPESIPFGATCVGVLEVAVAKDGEGFELKEVDSISETWWKTECVMVQHLQALGNEPGWELRIDPPNELVLRTNYGADEASFPFVLPEYRDGTWTYEVTIGMGEDADQLQVTITDEPCSDSMAGNEFPQTATVTHNGQTYQGCARDLEDAPEIQ